MTLKTATLFGIGAFIAAVLAGLGLFLAGQVLADVRTPSSAAAEVISYQGHLTDDQDQPIDGLVKLDFSIYNSGGDVVWSETHNDVPVTNGFFDVLLGANSPLSASHFSDPERFLEVTVNDGTPLPKQRLASVPYAFQADVAPWDGLSGVPAGFADGVDNGSNFENVIIVAKSGGDFTTLQAAIENVSGATAGNPTLVWVAPGTYDEIVTMKPNVHIQGAGQGVTILTSAASSNKFPPDATLKLAQSVTVRDLTVRNYGTGANNNTAAIVGASGISQTQLIDVTAEGWGTGVRSYGIYLSDQGTAVTLVDVTASARGATGVTATNEALRVQSGPSATVTRGSYNGQGGSIARGIAVATGSRGSVTDAEVSSESGDSNIALYIFDSSAELLGGSYTALGGNNTSGIDSNSVNSRSMVTVTLATVRAMGGSSTNFAFNNIGGQARLTGSQFVASGGSTSAGIFNSDVASPAVLLDVTSIAENASGFSYGLYNVGVVTATIRNSSFSAQGQGTVRGIQHDGGKLEGTNVSASSMGGATNYGLIVTGSSSEVIMAQSVFSGSSASVSRSGGTVTLSNSRLIGGPASGVVSCTLVSRGTAINSGTTCP
jgi:hypothetical protein